MDSVEGTSGAGYAHEGSEPFDRPAEKVLEAVLDDFCTVEHAREAYGVVVNPHTETVHRHHRNGGGIEVTAELKSNGTPVQHTGTSNGQQQPAPGSAAIPWERSRPLGAQPSPGSAARPLGAQPSLRAQPSPGSAARPLGAQPSPESAAVPWERSRPLGAQPSPESAAVPWERSRPLRAQPSPESAAVP